MKRSYSRLIVGILVLAFLLPMGSYSVQGSWDTDPHNLSDDSSWQMHPAIWGDLVVWEDYRDDPLGSWASPGNRNSNIYLHDLSSGDTVRLTHNDSSQVNPDIWENYVVWEDYRNGDPDIYLLDLDHPEEPLRITPDGAQKRPRIHGGRVVWEDYRDDHSYGDIYMYDIITGVETSISTEKTIQRAPSIYGDRIVWMDYRNFWDGAYPSMAADIFIYDIAQGIEWPLAEGERHQRDPSIYQDTVVWTERIDGSNSICMKTIGGDKIVVSSEPTSEEGPRIYGGRVVFFERYYEETVHLYDSIYLYDIERETKELVARVELGEGDPPAVVYARNPAIHRNRIIWEERHPSDHPRTNSQYDIYHLSLVNEPPEILWASMKSHTGEEGTHLNVILEEGVYVNISCGIRDKDGDIKRVYLYSEELDIDELIFERTSYFNYSVTLNITDKVEARITVIAEDHGGNTDTFDDLLLTVIPPEPVIIYVGVGTSTDDLGSVVELVLEEGNTLYFAAIIEGEVQSVRLIMEDYLTRDMSLENGTYVLSLPYDETMEVGNRTAYIEVVSEWDTVASDSMTIYFVEPEKTSSRGIGIFYIVLILIVVILAFTIVITFSRKRSV